MTPMEKIVWIFLAFVLFLILIHESLAFAQWSFNTSNAGTAYCYNEVIAGTLYDQCTLLVPGTTMTWKNQTFTWAGGPFCVGPSTNWTLQPASDAIDQGALIPDFHCPAPGSAIPQPRLSNGDYCKEWYGLAPDIGACEFVPLPKAAPGGLRFQ